ncbi:MAG: DUF4112 domain-containing protein [Candidatus Neomicrothrix subdominans]|nr:DUF4112 domain-containing protein [Candidatus Microthrix sp.]
MRAAVDEVLEPDEVIPAGDPIGASDRIDPDAVEVPAYVDALAWVLDDWIRIPVIDRRVGIDGAIGMIPVVGDGAGLVTSAIVILSAVRQGVSVPTVVRMVGNVLIDSMLGVVPFAGDAFDFMWKSNAKNVRLLRADLVEPQRTRRSSLAAIAISVMVVLALTTITVAAAALSVWLMVRLVRTVL